MLSEIESGWLQGVGYSIGLGLAAFASAYSAYNSKRARQSTDTINDAVNHRRLRADKDGKVPPKLYDAVLHLHEKTDNLHQKADKLNKKTDEIITWKSGYEGTPLDSGEKVSGFVDKVNKITDRLETLEQRKICPSGCSDCKENDEKT